MIKLNQDVKLEKIKLIEKGLLCNNFILYLRGNFFYIQLNSIQCFKFSIKRALTTLNFYDLDKFISLIISNINNIQIEKYNENLYYLKISYQIIEYVKYKDFIIEKKIKLKEINDFIEITNKDTKDIIIKKQNEKIISLLNKLKEYENKFKEPNTDDEFIIIK